MSRIKIYAGQIQNLTDARYFAAAGADYMGFCCDLSSDYYCPADKIRMILEWVEGPEAVLAFKDPVSADTIADLTHMTESTFLHLGIMNAGLPLTDVSVFQDIIIDDISDFVGDPNKYYILKSEFSFSDFTPAIMENMTFITSHYNCFIDFGYKTDELQNILSTYRIFGLLLNGSPEEKTGLKSYAQLDEILDLIEYKC